MIRLIPLALCLLSPVLLLAQAPPETKKALNRLAKETSPYLRMHAHNPTDWHPWGPEAFEKAKKENKLVFLSIGYSSCFWCHVMERESFNREDVAKVLNDGFVCIKVDREERPDIDHVYMTAVQTATGRGGWPLSVFLLPDGRPFFGGTYWPREDKTIDDETVPGFVSILKKIRSLYLEKRDEIEKAGEQVSAVTIRSLDGAAGFGVAVVSLDRKLLGEAVDSLREIFDPQFGGFGAPARGFAGPKFPMPPRLEFLLSQARREKDDGLMRMVTLTLDHMAQGGIYDHLGGGFHRYSTERTWLVPHFEKMLYDNAQLVELYSLAYQATKKPLYKKVVTDTLAYVKREMTSPEWAFYSSQDAETDHEEGRFYVWTPAELAAALPAATDADFVRQVYGAAGMPEFEKKYHILHRKKSLADLGRDLKMTEDQIEQKLEPLRKKLFETRGVRERPFRNDIAITAWSGLMIGAYAKAGEVFGERSHVETAAEAAKHVLKQQKTPEGRLLRTYGAAPGKAPAAAGPAYLEDYAFLVHGLLNLHDATKQKKWLDDAIALTDTMVRFHGDGKRGGYFITANDHEKLFARAKDQHDGAMPSGNSAAIRNLVRLWQATGDERFRAEADKGFRYFAGSLKSYGPSLTTLATALDLSLEVQAGKK
jgi:uncharacterized protein YyaL (SSP411 family)